MNEYGDKRGVGGPLYAVQRVAILLMIVAAFFPAFNPARVATKISDNISLFTTAVSYSSLTSEFARAFRMNWVSEGAFVVVYIAALVLLIGLIALTAGGCMSVGNKKMQKTGLLISLGGSVVALVGLVVCFIGYNQILSTTMESKIKNIGPKIPNGLYMYAVLTIIVLLVTLIVLATFPKLEPNMKYEMESRYKLFLMFLPFVAMAFVFCYLPLYGWRFAFFDYKSGGTLNADNFTGAKWFVYLFQNSATRADMVKVMRNTLIMSGLGICTSWIPMVFAIFLCEMNNLHFRRIVQTCTTIPNFISWVLVYALALAIFASDGFINSFMKAVGLLAADETGNNYLLGNSFTWVKMWAWGTWKGVGWSAIIYIAGISGIDRSLYEAATVDGAGRFQKMWHITLPGLLPTFFVLLLMAIAGCLSNGLDQYLVFQNPQNKESIRVLDLWVYELGIGNGSIPLSTVIGMFKSVISVILLFGANAVSKALRGESIV